MQTTINGARLFYTDQGDPQAPPVIFIHGFPFSHAMWSSQLEYLSHNFRTIALDLRGHGQSDVGDGQYTIEGHVDDLMGLLDHLQIDRTAIVGLSMGGYITLRAVERHPDRFGAIVLCDTRSEADDNAGKIKRAETAASVKVHGADVFARGFLPVVFAPDSFQKCPVAVETVRQLICGTPPLSLAGNLIAMAGRTDTSGSLGKIKAPTLILVGEHDNLTPVSAAQALQNGIPGAQLQVVPHAGHLSNLENPAAFNELLGTFLGQNQEL